MVFSSPYAAIVSIQGKIYLIKIAQLLVKGEVYLILVISCPTFANSNNSNGDTSSLVLTLRVI